MIFGNRSIPQQEHCDQLSVLTQIPSPQQLLQSNQTTPSSLLNPPAKGNTQTHLSMGTAENRVVLFSSNEAQVGEKYSCSSRSASSPVPVLVCFLKQAAFTPLVFIPTDFYLQVSVM